MYMGRDSGDMTIWSMAYSVQEGSPSQASASVSSMQVSASPAVTVTPVEVPLRLTRVLHPVVVMAREDPRLTGIRKPLLPRVLRMLQAIADEAARRGYELGAETGHGSTRLYVGAHGFRYSLRFREERERPAHVRPSPETSRPGTWRRRPDPVPTGRLQLSLNDDGRWWSDRKRWQLEDKLGEVFAKVERRIASDTARQEEEERRQAERHRQWEQAMASARDRFTEAKRREHFTAQLDAWHQAARIRQFCAALESATDARDDTGQRRAVRLWTEWAASYADSLDPVRTPGNLTDIDLGSEPAAEDLRPYLDGWSPHGPNVGYRW
jgi:hypothetical protein